MKLLFIAIACAILLFGCSQQAAQQNKNDTGAKSGQTANSEVLRLKEKAATAQWKIEFGYREGNATMVEYWKGSSNEFRKDLRGVPSEKQARVYIIAPTISTCKHENNTWTCTPPMIFMTPVDDLTHILGQEVYTWAGNPTTFDGSMVIVGINATCFSTDLPENIMRWRYCIGPDGAPLYKKEISIADGKVYGETIATSYSTDVSDSDFELPAIPTEEMNSS